MIICLDNYLNNLVSDIAGSSLFPTPPTITFVPEKDHCNRCHHPLKIRKTYPRKVVTLHIGTFYAKRTSSICPKCRHIYHSEELAKLVAPGTNFGYDIPFDRPHLVFARRLQEIYCQIEQFKAIQLRRNWRDNRAYFKIMGDMRKIMEDKVLWKTVDKIEPKIEVFDKLRDAMRIAPVSGKCGLNHDGMKSKISSIEQGVLPDPLRCC